LDLLIIILYALPLLWIFVYSLGQLHLVIQYWSKGQNRVYVKKTLPSAEKVPLVTIQLPIYNELYVVEGLLDAIAEFDYPKTKYEVQVLDDSTDETINIIAAKVAELKEKGIQIEHIRRLERKGFKAGALAYGMGFAKGEYIAIFDADFQPYKDFLTRSMAHFEDEKVGLVQTRWEHMNESYSILTRLQAFALDAHFVVEQLGRNVAGHFINFNGTAGIWRKSCIEDAGGWSSDTLTEDLDLSYRAQLKGWRFVFVDNIATPSELPVAMNAIKSQQFRWTKGAAECARKNLGRVLKAKQVSFNHKLHACFHLLNSSIFLSILLMSLLSVPVLLVLTQHSQYDWLFDWAGLLFISFGIVAVFFWAGFQHIKGRGIRNFLRFLGTFPLFWALSMGLALHNSLAVMEGYLGRKSPFVRTPKFNISKNKKNWKGNKYLNQRIHPLTYIEILLALYFLAGIVIAFVYNHFAMLPLHIGLFLGYTGIAYFSVVHLAKRG